MDDNTPNIESMARSLNRLELEHQSYDTLRQAFEDWYNDCLSIATTPRERAWLQQTYAMRVFGLAVQFNRSTVECEQEFQRAQAVGFVSHISHFLMLRQRAIYLADSGNVSEKSEVIKEMKRIVEATARQGAPSDWSQMILDLECYPLD